jgi:ankyrin repeat protein
VGLRTALHFLVGQKDTELVKLLLDKYHLDVNAQDFDGKDTPLLLTITNSRSVRRTCACRVFVMCCVSCVACCVLTAHCVQEMLPILLAHKAINVNLANRFGASPLHQAVANLNMLFVRSLLDKKANVDVRDKNERTPLHYALQRKHMDLVQALVAAGANVNAVDDNGRNGLHYAVNAADSGADASFEMEDFLLSHGAEVNQRDKHGRVPMHYAFVKIGHDVASQTSSIDPIETISSLCALDQLEIDPADHHGCTPLHYAAQRGATTCSLLLLNRKAALEHEDRDGNTPLGVAIKSGHGDYAIMLLQKKADVRHPIHYVTREWRQREGTTDPKDKVEVETGRYFRSMFYVAVVNGWQGVSYMMLDAGLDKLTALIDAINTGKFQLVVTLLSKTKRDEVVQGVDAHGRTLFHHLANYAQGNLDVKWATTLAEKLLARKVSMVALDKHGRLPLHYAARRGYYDLVWFFVTRHVDPSLVDKKGKRYTFLTMF